MPSVPLIACALALAAGTVAPPPPPAVAAPWRVPAPIVWAPPAVAVAAAVDPSGHEPHPHRDADCQARWGRELGPLLCPSLLGERDAASGREVEVRLLAALWHVARDRLSAWGQSGSRLAHATWAQLRPLLQEEAL